MVYSRYAYDSRRGQNPTLGIYSNNGYNPYSTGSTIESYEDHNSTRGNLSNYTLRVMPYNEGLREDFIDLIPSSVPIYLMIAITVILFLLCVV